MLSRQQENLAVFNKNTNSCLYLLLGQTRNQPALDLMATTRTRINSVLVKTSTD